MNYEPPAPGADDEQTPAPEPTPPVAPTPDEGIDDEELWPEDEVLGPDDEVLDDTEQAYLVDDSWRAAPAPLVAPPSRGGLASAIAVIILALGLIGMTVWGVKLHHDKVMAAGAATQLLALISEGAPAEMVKQLTAIQTDLSAGNIQSANDQIGALKSVVAAHKTGAEAGGPASGEPIPESAYSDIPADAGRFFRANQDLFRRFLMMCTRAREMRDAGKNVDALRKIRDEITEAARLGQKDVVQQKMLTMLQMLGGGAGNGGAGAGGQGPLAAKAQQLREIANQARKEGRDIRPVFMLMQKAEEAAQGGDMTAASKYLDEALAAAKRAPKMSRGDLARMRMGGGRRMGGGMNPLAPFLREVLLVMGAEDQNLRRVADDLLSAKSVLIGNKPPADQPELLKPMIDRAMGQMTIVADRRKELQTRMQQQKRPNGKPMMPARMGGRGRQVGGPGMTPEERQGMLAIVSDRVGLVLDRVRKLSDQDYARDRTLIVKDLLAAVFAPPTPEEQARLQPPKPLTPQAREDAVRANMLKASPALRKLELEGKDTQQVDALFAQARKDLYARKLDEAEKAVNQAMSILGLAPPPPLGPAASSPTPEPIKIDLRARPR